MGSAHHSALQWYQRFGVEPALDNEPADHLGLLLLFHAHLSAVDAPEPELAAYEAQHLSWVPRFPAKLEQQAVHPRFRSLAAELAEHLKRPPANSPAALSHSAFAPDHFNDARIRMGDDGWGLPVRAVRPRLCP